MLQSTFLFPPLHFAHLLLARLLARVSAILPTRTFFFFCTAGAEFTGCSSSSSSGSQPVIFRPGWCKWAASSAMCAARWRGRLFTYSENPQGPCWRSLKVTRTMLETPWLSICLSAVAAAHVASIIGQPPRSIMPINADKMDGGCAERKRLRSALPRRLFSFFFPFSAPPPRLPSLPPSFPCRRKWRLCGAKIKGRTYMDAAPYEIKSGLCKKKAMAVDPVDPRGGFF